MAKQSNRFLESMISSYTDVNHAAKQLGAVPKPIERGKYIGEAHNGKCYFILVDYRYAGPYRYPVGFEVRLFWMWINNEWTLTSQCRACAAPNKQHVVKDYTGKYDPPKRPHDGNEEEKNQIPILNTLTDPRWKAIEEEIKEMSHDEIMGLNSFSKPYLNEFIPKYRSHYKTHRNPDFARNFALNLLKAWFFNYPINVNHGVEKRSQGLQETRRSDDCEFCHGTGMTRGKPCRYCEGGT